MNAKNVTIAVIIFMLLIVSTLSVLALQRIGGIIERGEETSRTTTIDQYKRIIGPGSPVPPVLTYKLPESNLESSATKSPIQTFAIAPTKSEFVNGKEDILIEVTIGATSSDLKVWQGITCLATYDVLDVYYSGQQVYNNKFLYGPVYNGYIGALMINWKITKTFSSIGSYGAQHYLWCGDPIETFAKNNGCPSTSPTPDYILFESEVCRLYRTGKSQRISNVESTSFTLVNPPQTPVCSTEICDKIDNDCDGQIDEGNVCTGATCTNECESNDVKCLGNNIVSCGNYDSIDTCLEYQTTGGTVCQFGCESIGTGSAKCKGDTSTSCTSSWSCGEWSSCSGGVRTRACTDSKNCATPTNKQATSQACASDQVKFEVFNLEGKSEVYKDDTPPVYKVAVKNTGNVRATTYIETMYVAQSSKKYTDIKNIIGKNLFAAFGIEGVNLVPACKSAEGESFVQALQTKNLDPNEEITINVAPPFPQKDSVFADGTSNYDPLGKYLIFVGTYNKCGEGHTSAVGKNILIKTVLVPPKLEEKCDNRIDDDEDGLIDEGCKTTVPTTQGTQTPLTLEDVEDLEFFNDNSRNQILDTSQCDLPSDCAKKSGYKVQCTSFDKVIEITGAKIKRSDFTSWTESFGDWLNNIWGVKSKDGLCIATKEGIREEQNFCKVFGFLDNSVGSENSCTVGVIGLIILVIFMFGIMFK